MDYDDVITRLGSFGKYQRRLYVLISFPCLLTGFGAPSTSFIIGNHQHRCKIPSYLNDTFAVQSEEHLNLINRTIPLNSDGSYSKCTIFVDGVEEKCSEWVYDRSQFLNTVTSQFDLVCDRMLLRSHLKIVYLAGFLVASMISPIGDVIGRRLTMLLLITLRTAVVWVIPFVNNAALFGALRFFEGLTSLGMYQMSFVTAIELVGPSERFITANFSKLLYAFGEYLMLILVYFERDWKWVQIYLAIPALLTLILWWPGLVPESPRWLISRGKLERATRILTEVAKVNKIDKKVDANDIKIEVDRGMVVILKEVFNSKMLVVRWIIVTANWFVASFVYYGLTMNIGLLRGDLYQNFALLVLVELMGYCCIFLINKTGRRPMYRVFIFGTGIAPIVSIFLVLFADNTLPWLHIFFALLGRFGVTGLFAVLYMYTGELFPTVIRSIIVGTVSVGARVGSLISPYLYTVVDGQFGKILPLIAYAVLTIGVGICSLRLPETNNRKLIENVKDISLTIKSEVNGVEDHELTPLDKPPTTSMN